MNGMLFKVEALKWKPSISNSTHFILHPSAFILAFREHLLGGFAASKTGIP